MVGAYRCPTITGRSELSDERSLEGVIAELERVAGLLAADLREGGLGAQRTKDTEQATQILQAVIQTLTALCYDGSGNQGFLMPPNE